LQSPDRQFGMFPLWLQPCPKSFQLKKQPEINRGS
jgi:hypothetical protein